MARPKSNVVTAEGTRRSEEFLSDQPMGYGTGTMHVNGEEDTRFPGMHTVIVPKLDPADPRFASPIAEYEGAGYKKLSEDPLLSGSASSVVMGIPVDVWERRQLNLGKIHNGKLTELSGNAGGRFDGMSSTRGSAKYIEEAEFDEGVVRSGVQHGDPITVSGPLPDDED